jgi:nucleoside-diphosphate-sugar epimerase
MKIVVIGGTGLIGSKVVTCLEEEDNEVVADPKARYFGAELVERSLVPESAEHLGEIRFSDWLAQSATT